MTANLVLHWHLDALTPENLAVDTSDNHLNGAVTGAPANQPDERFGSVLRLHGSPDALTVPDTPVLRLTTYTLEVWLNTMPVIPPLTGIIGKPPNDFRLFLNADGTIVHRFSTTANADDGHATAAGLVTPGVWRHVAAVNDGHTASIYVDGKLVSSYAFTGDRVTAQVPLVVGEPHWYNGLLAHVRIYDGALTDVEIQRDMSEDEAALAAFVRAHPIDFALVSVDEQPVLFIDDAPAGQPMRLRITNTSRQDIEPLPLSGAASSTNFNYALHLRPGTLAVPPEPKVLNAGWSLLREVDPVNGETVLYLASVDPPGIGRGGAAGDPARRRVRRRQPGAQRRGHRQYPPVPDREFVAGHPAVAGGRVVHALLRRTGGERDPRVGPGGRRARGRGVARRAPGRPGRVGLVDHP